MGFANNSSGGPGRNLRDAPRPARRLVPHASLRPPVESYRIRPMPWWSALLLSGVAAFSLLLTGRLASTLRGEQAATTDPLHMAGAALIAFGFAAWVWHFTSDKDLPVAALRLKPVPASWVVLGLIAGAALQLPLAELGNRMAELNPSFRTPVDAQLGHKHLFEPATFKQGLITVLAVAAIIPTVEEVFFRGLVWSGLTARHGTTAALWVSTFAFGCMHFTPVGIATAWIAGLALGQISVWTRSILPSVALHMGYNALPLLLPERVVRIAGFNTVGETTLHIDWPLVIGSAAMAAVSLWSLQRAALTRESAR